MLVVNLDGYVTVNQRLIAALAKYPDLRVVEEPHRVETIGDQTLLVCTVWVYTTPDDSRPVRGSVTEPFPGKTPYTRNSELMVGMTSAVGRALGYLGFGIDSSIASNDEVAARVGTEREFDDVKPAVKSLHRAAQAAFDRAGPQPADDAAEAVLDAFPGSERKRRQEPTVKMVGFYKKLCAEHGINPDEQALADFDVCRAALDDLANRPKP